MADLTYDFTMPTDMVLLNREKIRKCDVPLGKEFVEKGKVWQATICRSTFRQVHAGGTFRCDDQWFGRASDTNAFVHPLHPNMPFGCPLFDDRVYFEDDIAVSLLEINFRGMAP